MTADERIAELEKRVTELEAENARFRRKLVTGSGQRMVDDERGRGTVVTVGGNNGGY